MKIGIDVRLWSQTGVGRYIRNLVQQLLVLDKNNRYVLFVRKQDYGIINDQLSTTRNKLKIENWKLEIADVRWHSLKEQFELPKILNNENLDLMHFPYFSVPLFYNRPYVLTIHDLIIDHFPTGKASTLFLPLYHIKILFYKLVIKVASKKAKKIISPSIATRDEIIDHLKIKNEKIVVTYEGTDENIKSSKNSEKLFKDYFLYVGNCYPHKNLENLILAFEKLSKEKKDLKLILVGNIDYFYKKIDGFIKRNNLEKKVVLFGKAKDSELFNLYKNAKALICASLMEGFGLPVLEAMSNKCLVVCSDIPSFREIAGESAIYFNPKVVGEIYKAFKKVDLKEYDTKIIEKAYNRSLEFSWKKTARETLKVYESSFSL